MQTSWLTPETTKSDWLLEIWSKLSILSTICAKNIFFWKFSNFASFLRSVCLTKVEFSSLSNILGNSTLEPFWLVNLAFVCTDDAGKHVKAAKTHFHRHLVQLETSKDQISLKFWYTEPWHVIPPPKFPKTRHNNGSESQLWDWLRTSEFHKKWCFCVPNIILKTKKNRRWWINIWFFLYHCDTPDFDPDSAEPVTTQEATRLLKRFGPAFAQDQYVHQVSFLKFIYNQFAQLKQSVFLMNISNVFDNVQLKEMVANSVIQVAKSFSRRHYKEPEQVCSIQQTRTHEPTLRWGTSNLGIVKLFLRK